MERDKGLGVSIIVDCKPKSTNRSGIVMSINVHVSSSQTRILHGLFKVNGTDDQSNASADDTFPSRIPATHLEHELPNLSWRSRNHRSRFLQRLCLITRRALATGNDRTRMTHPPTRRSGRTRNESNDRFRILSTLVVLFEVFRSFFFHGTTDFTDEDDTFRSGIVEEDFDDVDVLGSED